MLKSTIEFILGIEREKELFEDSDFWTQPEEEFRLRALRCKRKSDLCDTISLYILEGKPFIYELSKLLKLKERIEYVKYRVYEDQSILLIETENHEAAITIMNKAHLEHKDRYHELFKYSDHHYYGIKQYKPHDPVIERKTDSKRI